LSTTVLNTSVEPPARQSRSKSIILITFAAAVALLYFGRVFLITLICSVFIAFLLDPAVGLLVRWRFPRTVASFLVCSAALLGLYLVGVGVYFQVSDLAEELPTYSQRLNDIIDSVFVKVESMENSVYKVVVPRRIQEKEAQTQAPQQPAPTPPRNRQRRSAEPPPTVSAPVVPEVRIRQERTPFVNYIYTYISGFYQVLLMASFVPFLVYFMLSWRDHFLRSFLYLFQGEQRQIASATWAGIAEVARAYVVGNFILGVLLAIASAAFFYFVRLPYWLLVGPLSGGLSLIPYIGLPLAIIPPMFVALQKYDTITAYLVIGTTVAFFHLLALNLLYPKIVGSRVHLNPLAVTIALMFWGSVWGAIGLVLAIPITAAVKAVCDNVKSLEVYGKLLGD
jgi:predicted PurR-regulated permease PerM